MPALLRLLSYWRKLLVTFVVAEGEKEDQVLNQTTSLEAAPIGG